MRFNLPTARYGFDGSILLSQWNGNTLSEVWAFPVASYSHVKRDGRYVAPTADANSNAHIQTLRAKVRGAGVRRAASSGPGHHHLHYQRHRPGHARPAVPGQPAALLRRHRRAARQHLHSHRAPLWTDGGGRTYQHGHDPGAGPLFAIPTTPRGWRLWLRP